MTFGILALGFPVSEVLQVLQPLGAHSLTFFPILPYLNAFLRWRLASWPWGSLFRRFWRVLQPLGAHSLTFFPILPYLNAFLRWRLASWPWGSLFRRFCRFCSLSGLTVSLSSLFFPILIHSLGDVWHPGPGVPCFGGFASFAAFRGSPLGAHSLTFFPILPYLNAFLRWRLASWPWGSLFRRFWRVLQPLGAHSLAFFPILPYLNAFLRWRLASWPWGSLFRMFCRFCSLVGVSFSRLVQLRSTPCIRYLRHTHQFLDSIPRGTPYDGKTGFIWASPRFKVIRGFERLIILIILIN